MAPGASPRSACRRSSASTGLDPLVHALVWSLGANTAALPRGLAVQRAAAAGAAAGRALRRRLPRRRRDPRLRRRLRRAPRISSALAQRILGAGPAARPLPTRWPAAQGRAGELPAPDRRRHRPARARALGLGRRRLGARHGRPASPAAPTVGMTELFDIADETQRAHRDLAPARAEDASSSSGRAEQLREANARLRALDTQKDEFLSHVSHELRTPMTSIRSFSEILLGDEARSADGRARPLRRHHPVREPAPHPPHRRDPRPELPGGARPGGPARARRPRGGPRHRRRDRARSLRRASRRPDPTAARQGRPGADRPGQARPSLHQPDRQLGAPQRHAAGGDRRLELPPPEPGRLPWSRSPTTARGFPSCPPRADFRAVLPRRARRHRRPRPRDLGAESSRASAAASRRSAAPVAPASACSSRPIR